MDCLRSGVMPLFTVAGSKGIRALEKKMILNIKWLQNVDSETSWKKKILITFVYKVSSLNRFVYSGYSIPLNNEILLPFKYSYFMPVFQYFCLSAWFIVKYHVHYGLLIIFIYYEPLAILFLSFNFEKKIVHKTIFEINCFLIRTSWLLVIDRYENSR